jgi:hypothetical protein
MSKTTWIIISFLALGIAGFFEHWVRDREFGLERSSYHADRPMTIYPQSDSGPDELREIELRERETERWEKRKPVRGFADWFPVFTVSALGTGLLFLTVRKLV